MQTQYHSILEAPLTFLRTVTARLISPLNCLIGIGNKGNTFQDPLHLYKKCQTAGSNVSSAYSASAGTRTWPPELAHHSRVLYFLRKEGVTEIYFSFHTSAPVRLGVARPASGVLFTLQARCQYSSPQPNQTHPRRQVTRIM